MKDQLPIRQIMQTVDEIEPGLWSAWEHHFDQSYPESGHSNLMSVEDDSFWFRHRAGVLVDLVEKYPPSGVLFDVGGGNGYMVRALREAGHDAVLVEPGEDGSRNALNRGLAPVLWGTTSELGIAKGSLPSAGFFDVVEHLEDDAGFLEHIYDLVVPAGRIYLMVPAYQWLWSTNDERAGHFRRYRSETIRRLTSEVGFEVEYISYLFRVLTLPLLMLRSVPDRLGIGSGMAGSAEVHRLPRGPVGVQIARSLQRERERIRAGGSIRWGTSIVVVASKPD